MMGDMGGLGWWGPGFGWVFMLLFWLLIILGAAALIKWLVSQSRGTEQPREKTPLEILQARYARGEIGKEEYELKRRDLES
ncbi:MAG TPA: SHOCT domain-containing protein [Burkholderiales bacterium]|nr:SHOCT domain-containing protein [Burkholderiales bacterium]